MKLASYVVLTASTKLASTCCGKYGRVAVLKIRPNGTIPKCIRDTKDAKIIKTWENCNIGKTDRCAFSRAQDEAYELVQKLNDKQFFECSKFLKSVHGGTCEL